MDGITWRHLPPRRRGRQKLGGFKRYVTAGSKKRLQNVLGGTKRDGCEDQARSYLLGYALARRAARSDEGRKDAATRAASCSMRYKSSGEMVGTWKNNKRTLSGEVMPNREDGAIFVAHGGAAAAAPLRAAIGHSIALRIAARNAVAP